MRLQLSTEEGVAYSDSDERIIEEGALELNGQVAITLGSDYSDLRNVVGKASNLTREDGKLFVDAEFKDDVTYDENFVSQLNAYVWANELFEKDKTIKHANIRVINLFERI